MSKKPANNSVILRMKKTAFTLIITLSLACAACSGNKGQSVDSIPWEEVDDSVDYDTGDIELPQTFDPALDVIYKTVDSVKFIIMKMDFDQCYVSMADSVMPSKNDSTIFLCVEAAFTGQLLKQFKPNNVAGNYVIDGKLKKGYKCKANTGYLLWIPDSLGGIWSGDSREAEALAVKHKGTLFHQMLLIEDYKNVYAGHPIKPKAKNIYRAACTVDDGYFSFAVIQSLEPITLEAFIKSLQEMYVKEALYLDMGTGWNYGWYRESSSSPAVELFKVKSPYQTNWLVIKAKAI